MVTIWLKAIQSQLQCYPTIRRCLGCFQPIAPQQLWCTNCQTLLQPTPTRRCIQCGLAIASGTHCGECLKHPPAFDTTWVLDDYRWPLDQLIRRFKHQHQPLLGEGLAALFFTQHPLDSAASVTLCPVPMHWYKRWRRGFNQSAILCDTLAARYHLPQCDLFYRHRNSIDLIGLSKEERQRAVQHSYQLRHYSTLPNHVILIDDVMTTGATLNELARQLKQTGVHRVDCWVMARTPQGLAHERG
ncbi:ComF family protein [Celerinatantimonas yamalensis]|uniref:ComF family protein n=1 Tax=Celerinatantimonas yamalensis TaxID=559956 RepID=A0ABW9G997_9GAMM